jgi:hypothetical protein
MEEIDKYFETYPVAFGKVDIKIDSIPNEK